MGRAGHERATMPRPMTVAATTEVRACRWGRRVNRRARYAAIDAGLAPCWPKAARSSADNRPDRRRQRWRPWLPPVSVRCHDDDDEDAEGEDDDDDAGACRERAWHRTADNLSGRARDARPTRDRRPIAEGSGLAREGWATSDRRRDDEGAWLAARSRPMTPMEDSHRSPAERWCKRKDDEAHRDDEGVGYVTMAAPPPPPMNTERSPSSELRRTIDVPGSRSSSPVDVNLAFTARRRSSGWSTPRTR